MAWSGHSATLCANCTLSGAREVVIAPIGFISDHMEVLYDLDTEARALCEQLGLDLVRAATVGNHPAFVGMIRRTGARAHGRVTATMVGKRRAGPGRLRAGLLRAASREAYCGFLNNASKAVRASLELRGPCPLVVAALERRAMRRARL